MRDELALMSALREQGLSYEQAISLLALDAEAATDRLDRFDVRSEAVHYLNDFEADEMYESWPRDLSVFQRPLYPGQFHTLGRNFHTLIFPADLTTAADVERISQYLTLIRRGIPLRFGFVPLVETAEQRQAMAAFAEVHKVRSVEQAVELLRAAAIDNDLARPFGKLMKQAPEGPMALTSLDDLQDPDECTAASDWVLRFGGNAFINGIRVDLSGDSLQKIAQYMRDDTGMTQELVMSDDVQRLLLMNDLQDIFLAGANLRYSSALYGDRKYLKMAEVAELQHRCDKDFDIVSSGLTWPIEQTALPRGCITALDGRGEPRIVINGRVVEQLPIEDLDTLLEQEDAEASRVRKLAQSVGAVFSSRLLTILRSGRGLMRVEIPEVQGLNSFTTGQKDAPLQFRIFVDPLTKQAQRWSAIAQRLSGMSGVAVSITFSPQFNLKELPLKRYYRLALPGRYDIATRSELRFENLPSDLLVFELDPWDSWGIVPVVAAEDLDNLQLSSSSQVEAVFQIDHVLVQGHAREVNSERPPRGAQVELRGYDDTVVAETIVMANLGYFQLKAQLGTYTLALKPGRTTDVFKFSDLDVEVLGWSGVTIRPRLARNKGMEAADVLEGLGKSKKSLWDTVRGRQDKQPINIFTVASGHLYERFVYIMCTSVMEHTKQNVKFWFISNFLSPQFRRFIPHLAAELGFDYEFITFSWPNWLRRQTEKQRIIWGYKILFLDVMFPLDVDKVIFVDADQVVRADLQELVDEDLDGKVWGYTPMCDSRKEMEGYRFWKKGYWKDFLQGKPYHISALYVIDLFAFRQQAIGDRLRQQYHQLSADPASLSNLDQDLPNNMQHQVPIHSLPQEWLWCETWCDDKSLKKAKTIDLCQNPETKEPKLDRARRQLPEWTEFDERVKSLARKVAVKHQHLGSITSDVDEVGQNIAMVREQEAVVQVDRVDGASGHDEL
ncbi:killer toxin resistant protein [Savitreella phatthalungensis]